MSNTKFQWKDASSFSQSDKERIPNTFSVKTGTVTITVHRHIHYPGKWLVTCFDIRMDTKELVSVDIEDAKKEALTMVRNRMSLMLKSLENIE